ncbi:hypothetical protein BHL35_00225 [Bacillus cereus]|nr:hypothetical protein BHL35_00225 [Bacillus cereus]
MKTMYKLFHPDEVHVWKCKINEFKKYIKLYTTWLSNDEYTYAIQFKNEIRRQNYIICRGITKYIISLYTQTSPSHIEISYTQYRKPYLKNQNLYFNISHSADLVVVALAKKKIGIDIEKIKVLDNYQKIASHFLNNREKGIFYALDTLQQKHLFFTIWSSKEAVVKALGYGLHFPLQKVNVLQTNEQIVNSILIENSYYTIHNSSICAGYKSAICKKGIIQSIYMYDLKS